MYVISKKEMAYPYASYVMWIQTLCSRYGWLLRGGNKSPLSCDGLCCLHLLLTGWVPRLVTLTLQLSPRYCSESSCNLCLCCLHDFGWETPALSVTYPESCVCVCVVAYRRSVLPRRQSLCRAVGVCLRHSAESLGKHVCFQDPLRKPGSWLRDFDEESQKDSRHWTPNTASSGADGVPRVFKECAVEIVPVLVRLFRYCPNTKAFPFVFEACIGTPIQ